MPRAPADKCEGPLAQLGGTLPRVGLGEGTVTGL
jgi:hypothetical protein